MDCGFSTCSGGVLAAAETFRRNVSTRHLSLFFCHLSPVTCSLLLRRFPVEGVDIFAADVA
jgi:hypothetical protein